MFDFRDWQKKQQRMNTETALREMLLPGRRQDE